MPRHVTPSYANAVDWIAVNDEPTRMDAQAMTGQLTVVMVADLFGREEADVAEDIIYRREEIAEAEARDYAATESTKWRREL